MTREDERILLLVGDMLAQAEETKLAHGWTSAQMTELERECERARKHMSDPEKLVGITFEPLEALRRSVKG